MAWIFDKNEIERQIRTPIRTPLISVHVYEDAGFLVQGKPFKKYVQSIGFMKESEYENFKVANGII